MTFPWTPPLIAERRRCCGEFETRCGICQRPIVRRGVPAELAIGVALELFGIDRNALLSTCRDRELVEARAFVVWALRSLGRSASYPVIGRLLGGRDPSSAMHLHRRAIELRLFDNDFDAACRGLGERWMQLGDKHHVRCP